MFHRILAPMKSGQSAAPPSRAIDLAEKYAAELHVLYILTDGLVSRTHNREARSSQQELDQLASADEKVNVHREVRQGSFSDTVQKYTEEKQIDLVVFDRQASGVSSERVFRATVNRLLDALACPLLVTTDCHDEKGDDVQKDRIDSVSLSDESEVGMSAAVDLLKRGIAARATDIHIDPRGADSYVVRFRVDGRMNEFCTMQDDVAGTVMKQLKVMADVSLADPFQPSESRLKLPPSIPSYEVRITTAPVVNGQAVALRLINCDKLYRPLNELGLSAKSFSAVYEMLHQRSGLVLVAGPTGAGKTTTAYSMLNVLFTGQHNIVSIEDPVELLVPFMRQLSVDKRHGLTMNVALSTILRMDPDVVFVGEIRGEEAAQVAMQAAGCGKRAFSTMHMRDVSATVTAMRKLEVDSKTLADNLTGVITQRLVRLACQNCSQPGPITKHEGELFSSQGMDAPSEVVRARGCDRCRGIGYKERIGVFEAVVVKGDVAEAIRQEKNEDELRQVIREAGTPGLLADGLKKVQDGLTTIEELQEMSWLSESVFAPHSEEGVEEYYERGAPFKGAPVSPPV